MADFNSFEARARILWASPNPMMHEGFKRDLRESTLSAEEIARLRDTRPVGLSGTTKSNADELANFLERVASERRVSPAAAMPLTEDEKLELAILKRIVTHHKEASVAAGGNPSKCALELDLREVLREVTGKEGAELDYLAKHWHGRLAPPGVPARGILKGCSNSTHRFHARANSGPQNSRAASAWERICELEARAGIASEIVELEQKFRILLSPRQLERDFASHTSGPSPIAHAGILFLDVDLFKSLNTKHTEEVVDKTILPAIQRQIDSLVRGRGTAYRQGGDEFVILLPNHTREETEVFAERLRATIEDTSWEINGNKEGVTVSIGLAMWPDHGTNLDDIRGAANTAKQIGKQSGRNQVIWAS